MRINSISANTGYPKSAGKWSASRRENEYAQKTNQNNQINTTIKSNSDGRASFKGGVPFLHRAANFASDNPLVADALFALLITCGLRPICIMATAKNEEDKEKCQYQAAKSITSGIVGLAMTAVVGTVLGAAVKKANGNHAFKMPKEMQKQSEAIVEQGVNALTDLAKRLTADGNPSELANEITAVTDGGVINLGIFKKAGKGAQKLFKEKIKKVAPEIYETVSKAMKEQQVINNYEGTGKNVMDKFFQPIFMPIRADVTVALIPFILGLFGIHKNGNKPPVQEEPNPLKSLSYEVFQNNTEKDIFKSFMEVTTNESK